MIEQGTSAWKKSRIGYFTGSRIGDLMTSGKKKEDLFGKTALSYIYEVAAERDILPAYLDDDYLFEIYDRYVSINNKYLEHGKENESFAIERYEIETGHTCHEVESIKHPSIEWFSASPDRIADVGQKKIVVEVKCPSLKKFIEYKHLIHDNKSLKQVESDYFYQIQAELACTGLKEADFVAFCPFLKHPIHIVRITADEEVQKEIESRISEAEKIIEKLLSNEQH